MVAIQQNGSIFEKESGLAQTILSKTNASAILHEEHVQSLWSGYGQICRLTLQLPVAKGLALDTVIIKYVSPPVSQNHPRGWNTDTSNRRKIASYEVEMNWYLQYATHSDHACAMPKHIASCHERTHTWLILEDLDKKFPVRHQRLSVEQCKPCLRWLARFHARYLHESPDSLWPTGTYWHLATRKDEFETMQACELKHCATLIDETLNNARYKTFVHGDAKVANFCFSSDSTEVATVDFQYVGRGCGIKDVAYFLGSALSEIECQQHADALLEGYFFELRNNLALTEHEFEQLEAEWRELYCFAWADFHRFLMGWMPKHNKVNDYMYAMTGMALSRLRK